jgi:hypothetical protein
MAANIHSAVLGVATNIHNAIHGGADKAYEAHGGGDKLSKDLVDEMQAFFGKHPGYRTSMYVTTLYLDTTLILVFLSPRQRSSRGGKIYTNQGSPNTFDSCTLQQCLNSSISSLFRWRRLTPRS